MKEAVGTRGVKDDILCLLWDGDRRFTELMRLLGRPNRTVYTNLEKLRKGGLVKRVERGLYGLTRKGRSAAERVLRERDKAVPADILDWCEKGELSRKIEKKLLLHGAALDVRKELGAKHIVGSFGLLPIKELTRAYLKLGKLEKQYLRFLAGLYMNSPVRYLGKDKKRLGFLELRSAWQAVDPSAWNHPVKREGLVFDFPAAWERAKVPKDLRRKLKELGIGRAEVFGRLRAFSFPVRERMRLAREGKLVRKTKRR